MVAVGKTKTATPRPGRRAGPASQSQVAGLAPSRHGSRHARGKKPGNEKAAGKGLEGAGAHPAAEFPCH